LVQREGHYEIAQQTQSSLDELTADLKKWSKARPDLSFALDLEADEHLVNGR
jgi:midasin